jgi:F0F1-type ATP synthase assembly protein I
MPPPDSIGKKVSGSARQIALVMELPVVLVGSIIIAGGLGYLLDRWLHTSPVFTLILGGVGFLAGIYQLLRALNREDKNNGDGKSNGGT